MNAILAPSILAVVAIIAPGQKPYAKPIRVMLALNPKRGGCDVRTVCQLCLQSLHECDRCCSSSRALEGVERGYGYGPFHTRP